MGGAIALYSATCAVLGRYGNADIPYTINPTAILSLSGWLPSGSRYLSLLHLLFHFDQVRLVANEVVLMFVISLEILARFEFQDTHFSLPSYRTSSLLVPKLKFGNPIIYLTATLQK